MSKLKTRKVSSREAVESAIERVKRDEPWRQGPETSGRRGSRRGYASPGLARGRGAGWGKASPYLPHPCRRYRAPLTQEAQR